MPAYARTSCWNTQSVLMSVRYDVMDFIQIGRYKINADAGFTNILKLFITGTNECKYSSDSKYPIFSRSSKEDQRGRKGKVKESSDSC